MNGKLTVYSMALLLASVSSLSGPTVQGGTEAETDLAYNIYNEPLQPCGTSTMNPGSWDSSFKCSEKNGGVHQICIQNIAQTTNKFSLNTGQSDWSTGRGSDNHCVCLGAWSMYVARRNRKEITDGGKRQLKCDSIPRIALTKNYVKIFSKNPYYQGWQKWNGVQLENQIIDGVNQLFTQCSQNATVSQLKALKSNYCGFAQGIPTLEASDVYIHNCPSPLN